MHFLDILALFSFNLVEKAFATQQLAFLATSTYVFRLFDFWIFFSFSSLFAAVIYLLLGLLSCG